MPNLKKIVSVLVGITTATSLISCNPVEISANSYDKFNIKAVSLIKQLKDKVPKEVIQYTDAEFEALCYIVQNEVGNCSRASKIAVTNVVINRVKDNRFPNSIMGVITQKGQFTSISNYYNRKNKPTSDTIECVKSALFGEDNSGGALYFYNPTYCSYATRRWFESLFFCLALDGQRYFKN